MGAAIVPSVADAYLLTGAEAVALIQDGHMTVTEYAQSLLRRIDQRDQDVRAWIYLNKEYVLEQARILDATPINKRGPLHGMAVAVKDVIYTKGISLKLKIHSRDYARNCTIAESLPATNKLN